MMITALFLETAAVSSGRYIYPGYLININVLGGSVPLIILIGWSANLFLFTQLSMYTINRVYKCNNILQIVFISIGAGMIGVCLDLLEDTIANHNNWWRWTETIHGPAIFGVPISNFIDWFIILFFMSLVTQLIERSQVSENRKLLMSFFSIPVVGMSIFITHTLLLGTF